MIMKIIDKRLSVGKAFSELQVGECYKDEDAVLMKIIEIEAVNGMKLNCVSLASGMVYNQSEHSVVVPVDTELHIHTKR